jgi:hypothetical protein
MCIGEVEEIEVLENRDTWFFQLLISGMSLLNCNFLEGRKEGAQPG